VADVDFGKDLQISFVRFGQRPFVLTRMERHVKGPEVFIPMEGCSIFCLAPARDLDDPDAIPSPDEVTGFIIDGTTAVIVNKGVWHWAPFPITKQASFLLLLRKGTVETDLTIKDIYKETGIKMTLEIAADSSDA